MARIKVLKTFFILFIVSAFTAACGEQAPEQSLTDYLNAYQIEKLQTRPEMVTYNGIPAEVVGADLNAKLDDYSPAGNAEIRNAIREHYQTLKSYDRAALSEDEKLYYDVAMTVAERDMARLDGPGYYATSFLGYSVYPVTQMSGAHIDIPKLLQAQQSMASLKDAEDFIARLKAFAGVLDDNSALLVRDQVMGYILPTFALDKTITYIEGMITPPVEDNPLYVVFTKKLGQIAEVSEEERAALGAEVIEVLESEVFPAYQRMIDLLSAQRPLSHAEAGLWAQPGGDALYAKMAQAMGDTDLTPEEIHQLGLSEVARITAEMDAILIAEGYSEGTVGERMRQLSEEPRFIYPNTDEGKARLIADLNGLLDAMKARLPAYFITIPKADVEVRRVSPFTEATDPGGFYDGPSLDGSRPGIYWINLRDTAENPSWSLPTLTYHESIPGHHFEVAQGVTATDRPLFRRLASFNAFSEGWALYAEHLAKEMGAYEGDPYGDLGRLNDEMLRAVRLVVDTGMHYKHWSRDQAIDYMASKTGSARSSVVTEIERYVVWPGQALGYKLGMLKFQQLRARAEQALGDRFDIRQFHEVVLGKGAMPMRVVEMRVDAWIKGQQD